MQKENNMIMSNMIHYYFDKQLYNLSHNMHDTEQFEQNFNHIM